jgi:ribonuclease HII
MIEDTLVASGINMIAGCDEAGRGPCAGPLVVAAVLLRFPLEKALHEIADSKELSQGKRSELYKVIIDQAISYCIVEISAAEIDQKGLHKCNLEGMRRAINSLNVRPEYVFTDGYQIDGLEIPALAIWKGDKVCASVGAASIIAKVHRDRIMCEMDLKYPGYGFADHKGYITAQHTAALANLGISDIHRKSFANIANLINR